jgi:mannose-1-phosphate guanylyltransferase
MNVQAEEPDRWALVLAGGLGTRLRSMTRRIAGDERPKQFCALLGGDTAWEQTCARAQRVVPGEAVLSIVTREHASFYAPLLARVPGEVLVQPRGCGTAPAILYGLRRLVPAGPAASVVILPSDHYVSDEGRFMAHVSRAFAAVDCRPDLIVLLGITPDHPEVEYGWIETGEGIPLLADAICYRVQRFWEKPSLPVAMRLFARGCLWNSFVMVGRVGTFLAVMRRAVPALCDAMLAKGGSTDRLYAGLPSTSFSRTVLATQPANLGVLPVRGVRWSDLGTPRRLLEAVTWSGHRPAWLDAVAAEVVSKPA